LRDRERHGRPRDRLRARRTGEGMGVPRDGRHRGDRELPVHVHVRTARRRALGHARRARAAGSV